MIERSVWYTVIAIGLVSTILYGGELLPEPLKLNSTGCHFYAQDAGQIAAIRDSGAPEEATQERYAALPYHEHVKPHLVKLIRFIYSSSLTPEEAQRSLYRECMENKGRIGEDA